MARAPGETPPGHFQAIWCSRTSSLGVFLQLLFFMYSGVSDPMDFEHRWFGQRRNPAQRRHNRCFEHHDGARLAYRVFHISCWISGWCWYSVLKLGMLGVSLIGTRTFLSTWRQFRFHCLSSNGPALMGLPRWQVKWFSELTGYTAGVS